jgi:hypothetical protein
MPFFRVMVHGSGIALFTATEEGAKPATGFYITRVVRAASGSIAGDKAVARVLAEWRGAADGLVETENLPPTVEIESVAPARFLDWIRARDTGYAFYQTDGEPEVASGA